MNPNELLLHRELELLRAAGRIRKGGRNNQKARSRTKERSKKLAQAIAIKQRYDKKEVKEIRLTAKFTVVSVLAMCFGAVGEKSGESVVLEPVYSDDPSSENYSFSKATPSGRLELGITNPDAYGFFVEGQEYFLNIVPANQAEAEAASLIEIDDTPQTLRPLLTRIIQKLRGDGQNGTRQKSIAITKLEEARLWLGDDAKGA